MKILILGDSFAADWTIKYNEYKGWPNLLAEKYNVTNLAQAGVSEYKIYKQLKSQTNLDQYDIIIVSHTSPYRVHTIKHPLLSNDTLHKNADLMLNDIEYHSSKFRNYFNKSLKSASAFFKYHFDQEYYETTYSLYRQSIINNLENYTYISLDFFKDVDSTDSLTLHDIYKQHTGKINHMSEQGNKIVFDILYNAINKKLKLRE